MKKLLTLSAIIMFPLIASSALAAHVNPRVNQTRIYNEHGQHVRACDTDADCCTKNPTMCEPGDAGHPATFIDTRSPYVSEEANDLMIKLYQEDHEASDLKENFCILNQNIALEQGQLGQSVMKPTGKKLAKLLTMVANKTAAHGACDGEININEIPVCADSGANDEVPACSAGCVLESLDMQLSIDKCQKALHVRINK